MTDKSIGIKSRKKQPSEVSTVENTSHNLDIGRRTPSNKKETKMSGEKITPITVSRPRRTLKPVTAVVVAKEPEITSDSSASTEPPCQREEKRVVIRKTVPCPEKLCDLVKTFLSKCETKTQRKDTVFIKKIKIDSAQIKQIAIKLRQVNNGNELFRLNKIQSELKHCRQYLDAGFTIIPVETDKQKLRPFLNELGKYNSEFLKKIMKSNLFGIYLGKFHCENLAFQFLEDDIKNALLHKSYTKLKIKRIERFVLEHFNVLQKEDLKKIDELFSCRNEIKKALNDYDGTKLNLPLEQLISASNYPISELENLQKKLSEYSKDSDVSRKKWPSLVEVSSIFREGISDFINMPCFEFVKEYLNQFSNSYVSNCSENFDDDGKSEIRANKILFSSIVNCITIQVLIAVNEAVSQKLRNRDCDGFIGFPNENAILVRKFCDMPLTDADIETIENAVAEKIGFKYQLFQSKLNSTYLGDKNCHDDDEEDESNEVSDDDEDEDEILYREQKIEVEKKYFFLRDSLAVIEMKEELFCTSTENDLWNKCPVFNVHSDEKIVKHFEMVNDALFFDKRFDIQRWIRDENKIQVNKLIAFPNKPFGPVMLVPGDKSSYVFNTLLPCSFPEIEGEVYNPVSDGEIVKIYIDYLADLVGGDGNVDVNINYILNMLSYKIQYPQRKMMVALILQGKMGVGKDLFCDSVVGNIWRQQYRISTNPKHDLFEKHANIYAGSTIIKIEELNFVQTQADFETWKGRITCPVIDLNPKNKDLYVIPSYHWFIATTNNTIPLKITDDDRRTVMFVSKGQLNKNNEKGFWKNKRDQLSDQKNLSAFCRFLRSRDVSTFDAKENRPETDIYKYNKVAQRNPIYGYFENICNTYMIAKLTPGAEMPKQFIDGTYKLTASSFYNEVISYLTRSGYCKDGAMSMIKFGRLISNLFPEDALIKSKSNIIQYTIDFQKTENHMREKGVWSGFERE
jgi:hypothetical protein